MAQLMLPLHKGSAASTRTKLAVFRTVPMAQLVYASQTWTLRETEWKKLHALEMRCLGTGEGSVPEVQKEVH